MFRNSTFSIAQSVPEYWAQFDQISNTYTSLNYFEKLWAAWYAYMDNDTLATGLLSFTMHEVVYFGRSLPWIIMDSMPSIFGRFKIQQGKIPSVRDQWKCALLVLLQHFTVELPQIW
jgi:methylsterol monooxygenase